MTKEELKQIPPETMATFGVLKSALKSGYICPVCGNGSGDNGTGLDFDFIDGAYLTHCFKCGCNFSIFEIIESVFNIHNFTDIFNIANDIFDGKAKPKVIPEKVAVEHDYKNYICAMHENLKAFVGESYRGISFDTYDKFFCGYDFDTQRFIIPYNFKHYLERYTGTDDIKNPKKHSAGAKPIFNVKAALNSDVIFIVEGEFDSVSLAQIGYTAISFGGCNPSKEQWKLFSEKFPKDKNFIIMLDNDDAGIDAAQIYSRKLKSLGFKSCIRFLDNFNDSNEYLQNDSIGFKNCVDNIFNNRNSDDIPRNDLFETQSADKNIRSIDVFKNAPINLSLPDGYSYDNHTIKIIHDKKPPAVITNTPILITKIIRTESFNDCLIELAIQDIKTKTWHFHQVKRGWLAQTKNIPELANFGLSVDSSSAAMLSAFLIKLLNFKLNPWNIPEIIMQNYLGWSDDNNFFNFPHKDGDSLCNVEYNYDNKFYSAGDKSEWLQFFSNAFISSLAVRLAVGTTLAAPLIKICNVPNIQLAFIASTGRGKSAICNLAFSIWGNPEKLKNIFNSTPNYADNLSKYYIDIPCWIDEFQTAGKAFKEKIETAIYNFAEGLTRGRLDRAGNAKSVITFRGSRIYTAEESVLKNCANAGAYARLMEFDINKIISDDIARKMHQLTKKNFGHFSIDWLKFIGENKADIIETQKRFFLELQDKFPNHHTRHLQAVSTIETAIHFFAQMTGFLADEPDYLETFLRPVDRKDIFNILPTYKQASNSERALKDLAESLKTFRRHYDEYNKSTEKIEAAPMEPTFGVIFKNGDVGFYPRQIRKYLETDCNYSSAAAIFKSLWEDDKLSGGSPESHYLTQKRVRDSRAWFYIVKAEYLAD